MDSRTTDMAENTLAGQGERPHLYRVNSDPICVLILSTSSLLILLLDHPMQDMCKTQTWQRYEDGDNHFKPCEFIPRLVTMGDTGVYARWRHEGVNPVAPI
jgi:hypothetical protein